MVTNTYWKPATSTSTPSYDSSTVLGTWTTSGISIIPEHQTYYGERVTGIEYEPSTDTYRITISTSTEPQWITPHQVKKNGLEDPRVKELIQEWLNEVRRER